MAFIVRINSTNLEIPEHKMKNYLLTAFAICLFPSALLAFDPQSEIDITKCWDGDRTQSVQCLQREIDACVDRADSSDSGIAYRSCPFPALDQADQRLNIVYQQAILDAKKFDMERQVPEDADGFEDLLRVAQRDWVKMRDSTCLLNPSRLLIMSGFDGVVAECAAKLTVERAYFLENDILNAENKP